MLSAICFSLDQFKILLSGMGLIVYHTMPIYIVFPNYLIFYTLPNWKILQMTILHLMKMAEVTKR